MFSSFFYDAVSENTELARKDWGRGSKFFRLVFRLQSYYPFGRNNRSRSEGDQRFEDSLLHITSLAGTHFLLSPPAVLEAY